MTEPTICPEPHSVVRRVLATTHGSLARGDKRQVVVRTQQGVDEGDGGGGPAQQ